MFKKTVFALVATVMTTVSASADVLGITNHLDTEFPGVFSEQALNRISNSIDNSFDRAYDKASNFSRTSPIYARSYAGRSGARRALRTVQELHRVGEINPYALGPASHLIQLHIDTYVAAEEHNRVARTPYVNPRAGCTQWGLIDICV